MGVDAAIRCSRRIYGAEWVDEARGEWAMKRVTEERARRRKAIMAGAACAWCGRKDDKREAPGVLAIVDKEMGR